MAQGGTFEGIFDAKTNGFEAFLSAFGAKMGENYALLKRLFSPILLIHLLRLRAFA